MKPTLEKALCQADSYRLVIEKFGWEAGIVRDNPYAGEMVVLADEVVRLQRESGAVAEQASKNMLNATFAALGVRDIQDYIKSLPSPVKRAYARAYAEGKKWDSGLPTGKAREEIRMAIDDIRHDALKDHPCCIHHGDCKRPSGCCRGA